MKLMLRAINRAAEPLPPASELVAHPDVRAILVHVMAHGCQCGQSQLPPADLGVITTGRTSPLSSLVGACQACAATLVERHAVVEWRPERALGAEVLEAHLAAIRAAVYDLSLGHVEGIRIEAAARSLRGLRMILYRPVAQ